MKIAMILTIFLAVGCGSLPPYEAKDEKAKAPVEEKEETVNLQETAGQGERPSKVTKEDLNKGGRACGAMSYAAFDHERMWEASKAVSVSINLKEQLGADPSGNLLVYDIDGAGPKPALGLSKESVLVFDLANADDREKINVVFNRRSADSRVFSYCDDQIFSGSESRIFPAVEGKVKITVQPAGEKAPLFGVRVELENVKFSTPDSTETIEIEKHDSGDLTAGWYAG